MTTGAQFTHITHITHMEKPVAKKDDDTFDLDALVAEAARDPFRFRLGGKTWTLPQYGSLDWKVLEYGDSNELTFSREALRIGLGDQWETFSEIPLGLNAVGELFERWVKHSGVRPGESAASSDS